MLEKVKLALRVSSDAFDTEITDLIASAKLDLGISGVLNTADTDKLVAQAIILYCKAYFSIDSPNSEQYLKAYTSLKTHMSLAKGYRVEVVE